MKTYTVEELFSDIPGDSANVLLTIPPEILELVGWEAGDMLSIKVEDETMVIRRQNDNT